MSKAIPNLQTFLLLIFISLLILLIDNFHVLDFAKRISFYITNPISFTIYKINQGVANQFHFIFSARQSSQENKALKEQIGTLLSENAKVRQKLAELEAQVTQEKFINSKTYNLIPARPIGLSRFLNIDKVENKAAKYNITIKNLPVKE